ncbi:hypothetical protein [Arthrobacter glacialis]|uniref:hypothetical protein n=1 Tax=Arthrobacter glacialis TaxID=1664 RepID=UPI001FAEBC16|nr:hypothetical protein [Arthrobacter glacialis]
MPSSSEFSARRPYVTDVELIGGVEKRSLTIVEYDPIWPAIFNISSRACGETDCRHPRNGC